MAHPRTHMMLTLLHQLEKKYGPSVYDQTAGREWDWGQAVCREAYGPRWTTDTIPVTPTENDIKVAQAMLGTLPAWAIVKNPPQPEVASEESESREADPDAPKSD